MNDSNELFTDEYFNLHVREKLLGQGGQGVVFRTKDPDVAIKIVTDDKGNPFTDPKKIQEFKVRLRNVKLLPLSNDINISVPVALLKDQAGYVMQLLNDMIPFSDFWLDGKAASCISEDEIPIWLKGIDEVNAKKIFHYCKTGGLRRRLIVLCKCSVVLAKLHSLGLVYGDVSPNNVFQSKDASSSEVWLIDADNLRYESKYHDFSPYTPQFGAPELLQGVDCGRARTDCHAFAVMAFYILAMVHPFIGKKVLESDDDWANDNCEMSIEDQAMAGFLPWVDDINDDSNSTDSGLPRALILTKKLSLLFQKTFGDGREKYWKRPAIYHWPEALIEAADKTLQCSECNMSWYADIEEKVCPYCGAKRTPFLKIQAFNWKGKNELDSPCWTLLRELPENDEPINIPERIFQPFSIRNYDNSALTMNIDDKHVIIVKSETDNQNILIALKGENKGAFRGFISQIQLPVSALKTGFWIFVPGDEPRIINCCVMEDNK